MDTTPRTEKRRVARGRQGILGGEEKEINVHEITAKAEAMRDCMKEPGLL